MHYGFLILLLFCITVLVGNVYSLKFVSAFDKASIQTITLNDGSNTQAKCLSDDDTINVKSYGLCLFSTFSFIGVLFMILSYVMKFDRYESKVLFKVSAVIIGIALIFMIVFIVFLFSINIVNYSNTLLCIEDSSKYSSSMITSCYIFCVSAIILTSCSIILCIYAMATHGDNLKIITGSITGTETNMWGNP